MLMYHCHRNYEPSSDQRTGVCKNYGSRCVSKGACKNGNCAAHHALSVGSTAKGGSPDALSFWTIFSRREYTARIKYFCNHRVRLASFFTVCECVCLCI